jgi:hypothetical protein
LPGKTLACYYPSKYSINGIQLIDNMVLCKTESQSILRYIRHGKLIGQWNSESSTVRIYDDNGKVYDIISIAL